MNGGPPSVLRAASISLESLRRSGAPRMGGTGTGRRSSSTWAVASVHCRSANVNSRIILTQSKAARHTGPSLLASWPENGWPSDVFRARMSGRREPIDRSCEEIAMNRRAFLKHVALGGDGAALAGCRSVERAEPKTGRPNVILVLTDDQGYGDLSCHGNPVLRTPNLDRLHKQSIRLTDFHVAPM